MKILLASHHFLPDIGGIEVMSSLLAEGFCAAGHDVKVVTQTSKSNQGKDDSNPYSIVRNPTKKELLQLVKWCDVYFHNNICLQMAWPLLLVRRPWVVAHHTWLYDTNGVAGRQAKAKQFLLRFARGISVSQAIADHVSAPSVVIGNCYRDDLFFEVADSPRDRDLVSLGRLVSDKGIDLLLDALGELKKRGLTPSLTVIGDGPELESLQAQAATLNIETQVAFVGAKRGDELRELLNQHKIMVVPSRWKEPFGLVALEGIACGCVAIGSEGGGLKDAIGPCGSTFPNGDVPELTDNIADFLTHPEHLKNCRKEAPAHLAEHSSKTVVNRYLQVIESAALRR